MPTKIQLKRGAKSNLPILSTGEAAFTTDTKEFFIGDGSANYNFTPARPNLLTNGNFQVALPEYTLYPPITLTPGQGRYIFGNYYIYNDVTATGNMTVEYYNNPDVSLKIVCTNAKPNLEYRAKVARTPMTQPNFEYLYPFADRSVTLSLLISNWQATSMNNVKSGLPGTYKNWTIPNGAQVYSNTFTMGYPIFNTYKMMQICLFRLETNYTGTFVLGSVKLEIGNTATAFSANPLSSDIASIEQSYCVRADTLVACGVYPNLLRFWMPNPIPYAYNYGNILVTLNQFSVNDGITNQTQTGFTVMGVAVETAYPQISIQLSKTGHGLTSAYGFFQITVDARPK